MFHRPTLLLPTAYVKDATKAIRTAKRRVSFLCMLVTDDEATDQLIDALSEAAERGVIVEVAADVFTYGELSGHFIPTRYFTRKTRNTTHMARRLRASKVRFSWLGRFSNTPFTGRTHIKWCVVDDAIYSFGGVNLYDRGLKNVDYMFKITDNTLADLLDSEFDRLVAADSGQFAYRSRSLPSRFGTVHIDGGLPFDSTIYRRACELTRDAVSVLYVSQYGPTGKLHRALKKTPSTLYFNSGTHGSFLSRMVLGFTKLLTWHKNSYTRQDYLHAKFMIFTMKGGQKIALTGSHNFVQGGVLLGTREIALETTDQKIVAQLEQFFKKYVG